MSILKVKLNVYMKGSDLKNLCRLVREVTPFSKKKAINRKQERYGGIIIINQLINKYLCNP